MLGKYTHNMDPMFRKRQLGRTFFLYPVEKNNIPLDFAVTVHLRTKQW